MEKNSITVSYRLYRFKSYITSFYRVYQDCSGIDEKIKNDLKLIKNALYDYDVEAEVKHIIE